MRSELACYAIPVWEQYVFKLACLLVTAQDKAASLDKLHSLSKEDISHLLAPMPVNAATYACLPLCRWASRLSESELIRFLCKT